MDISKLNVETVDIWSVLYTTSLHGSRDEVGTVKDDTQISGFRTLYRSCIRNHYYFLVDSRYEEDSNIYYL